MRSVMTRVVNQCCARNAIQDMREICDHWRSG